MFRRAGRGRPTVGLSHLYPGREAAKTQTRNADDKTLQVQPYCVPGTESMLGTNKAASPGKLPSLLVPAVSRASEVPPAVGKLTGESTWRTLAHCRATSLKNRLALL